MEKIEIVIQAIDKATKPLKEIQNRIGSLGQTIGSAGAAFTRAGMMMSAAVLPIVGAFGLAIRTGVEFEQQMKNVQSVAQASQEDFIKLSEFARKMGEQTIFSASEAAQAMYYLASAGYDASRIMESLEGILDLAAATQTDLAFATETVLSVLNSFGMEAKEATKISDKFAATISGSQATMEKLAYSMRYVAPLFKSLGYTIDELLVALGGLYNAGYRGEQAGTILRGALSRLIDPTKEVLETISRLGLEIYELTPAALEIKRQFDKQSEALRELREEYEKTINAMSEMNDEMSKLADKEARLRLEIKKIRYKAAKEGRELTEDEKKQIKELELAIDELSIRQDELRLKYKELSRTKEEQIAQIKSLESAVEALAEKFAKSPKKLKQFKILMEEFRKTSMTAADAVKIFGQEAGPGMMALISQYGTEALDMLEEKIKNASGAAKEMAEIQLKSTAGALKELKSKIEDIQITIFEELKDEIDALINTIKENMPAIKEFTKEFTENMVPAAKTFGEILLDLMKTFNKLPAPVKESVARFSALAVVFMAVGGPMLMVLGGAMQVVGAMISIGSAISGLIGGGGILATLVALLGPVGVALLALAAAAAVLYAAWVNNWFGIRDKTKELVEKLSKSISGFWKWFVNAWSGGWKRIKEGSINTLATLGKIFGNALSLIYNNIVAKFVEGFINAINTVIGSVNKFIAFMSTVPYIGEKLKDVSIPTLKIPNIRIDLGPAIEARILGLKGTEINNSVTVNVNVQTDADPDVIADRVGRVVLRKLADAYTVRRGMI
ncbi:phage tail tape measure protein [Geoglobus acetivorans]|uniref:Phage tail tape measure protein n=1 Tax=Geoglobus acetivorans TaxID=565033 RepID=A0ABZ3H4J4_GEOAI|nr:phage tail tape measure protein [Geoglobus acetivorans]